MFTFCAIGLAALLLWTFYDHHKTHGGHMWVLVVAPLVFLYLTGK